jgi:hypothetical protein
MKDAQTMIKAVIKYPRVNDISAERPKPFPINTEFTGICANRVKESKQIKSTIAKEIKMRDSNSNFLIFLIFIFMILPLTPSYDSLYLWIA